MHPTPPAKGEKWGYNHTTVEQLSSSYPFYNSRFSRFTDGQKLFATLNVVQAES